MGNPVKYCFVCGKKCSGYKCIKCYKIKSLKPRYRKKYVEAEECLSEEKN